MHQPSSPSPLRPIDPASRIAIVRSSYYGELVSAMEDAARSILLEAGLRAESLRTVTVPGSFEIPLACKILAEGRKVDGILALGIVIEGETHHAAEIMRACTDGLREVQLQFSLPIAHEVLFVKNTAQAHSRTGKGAEAARSLLEMMLLLREETA
jgi:6,7-dimethyl-8-ribityllumazine synthase